MKKKLFPAYLAAAMAMAGCTNNNEEGLGSEQPDSRFTGQPVTVTMNAIVGKPETRTAYDDDTNADHLVVKWTTDDKIGVFTDKSNRAANALGTIPPEGGLSDNHKSARFTATLNAGTSTEVLAAYYPYAAGNTDPAAIPINLNGQTQTGFPGDLSHLAAYDFMTAGVNNVSIQGGGSLPDLTFTPLLAVMSFDITNPTGSSIDVDSVILSNEAALSRQETGFAYNSATVNIYWNTLSYSDENKVSSLKLKATDCTIPASETRRFDMMMFPIATQIIPKYLYITVKTTNEFTWSQVKKAPESINAGERYIAKVDKKLPEPWDGTTKTEPFKYSEGGYTTYCISTPGELAWIEDQTFSNTKFILLNDLDLNEKEWTPIKRGQNFYGNGHTIKGLKITKTESNQIGLFKEAMNVYDLRVEGEIALENVSKTTKVGGIAGIFTGQNSNCESACTITVSGGNNVIIYVGGVCGHVQNQSQNDLRYTGTKVELSGGSESSFRGGVIGYVMAMASITITGSTTLSDMNIIGGCQISAGKTLTVNDTPAVNGKPFPVPAN